MRLRYAALRCGMLENTHYVNTDLLPRSTHRHVDDGQSIGNLCGSDRSKQTPVIRSTASNITRNHSSRQVHNVLSEGGTSCSVVQAFLLKNDISFSYNHNRLHFVTDRHAVGRRDRQTKVSCQLPIILREAVQAAKMRQ